MSPRRDTTPSSRTKERAADRSRTAVSLGRADGPFGGEGPREREEPEAEDEVRGAEVRLRERVGERARHHRDERSRERLDRHEHERDESERGGDASERP